MGVECGQRSLFSGIEDLHLVAADDEIVAHLQLPGVFVLLPLQNIRQLLCQSASSGHGFFAAALQLLCSEQFDVCREALDGPAVIFLPPHRLLVVYFDGVVEVGDLAKQLFPRAPRRVLRTLVAAG